MPVSPFPCLTSPRRWRKRHSCFVSLHMHRGVLSLCVFSSTSLVLSFFPHSFWWCESVEQQGSSFQPNDTPLTWGLIDKSGTAASPRTTRKSLLSFPYSASFSVLVPRLYRVCIIFFFCLISLYWHSPSLSRFFALPDSCPQLQPSENCFDVLQENRSLSLKAETEKTFGWNVKVFNIFF